MARDRQVDEKQALGKSSFFIPPVTFANGLVSEFADSVGAKHVTCSAKTGKDVDTVFLELTRAMLAHHQVCPLARFASLRTSLRGQAKEPEAATSGMLSSLNVDVLSVSLSTGSSNRKKVVIDEDEPKPDGCGC